MEEVTLGLAVLLATGMFVAKVGQFFKLPSVTGYILAGFLLGPGGFGLVTAQSVGHQLDHFTRIALMLIAFGIGEQIELKRLLAAARSITLIGCCEAMGALLLVTGAVSAAVFFSGIDSRFHLPHDFLVMALLLGSVAVATAPATTLHVVRDIKARGPLTSTLMAVIAINNGLAIIFFGMAMSFAGQLVGSGGSWLAGPLVGGLFEVGMSLFAGIVTGLLISFVSHYLKRQGEMLTVGLALLLLCGEFCRAFHFSPLLAGMAAGFAVINRVTRDVRLFRALNAFEPPIYVLFFTLAGTHLDFSAIGKAGWLGLVYFVFRASGKYCGAFCGAWLAGAPTTVRRYLGLALVSQAEVAIGLVILIGSEPGLAAFSQVLAPVVLVGVMLSELTGPLAARFAVQRAGEDGATRTTARRSVGEKNNHVGRPQPRQPDVSLVPWSWEKLRPDPTPDGVVAFGASHPLTVCGLARIATILAHHYRALPLAVRVLAPDRMAGSDSAVAGHAFHREREETRSLGYELATELIPDRSVASGLVAAVEYNRARAVVLGYPLEGTVQGFHEILDKVAANVACPVVVVRFHGELHTEKILVPVRSMEELTNVGPIVHAFSRVGSHQVTILYLLPADESDDKATMKRREMEEWVKRRDITAQINFQVERTEARQETILKESNAHDLVIMGTLRRNVLQRLFFGSLAETVARSIQRPLLIVYRPKNDFSSTES